MKNKREEELKQKEFENDIAQELRNQELDREFQEMQDKDYHPLGLAAIRFFGNLLVGYIIYRIFFFLFYWFGGVAISMFSPEIVFLAKTIFMLLIVGFAIIGVITKKSPWEKFF